MAKSTRAVHKADNGMISLGKKIFLMMLELVIMLSEAWDTDEKKRFHNTSPESTNTE